MNIEQILEMRNKAIDNVSKKRVINGQVERTWMQDDFDIEFARLILQSVETKQEKQLRMYKESFAEDDGGIMSWHFVNKE